MKDTISEIENIKKKILDLAIRGKLVSQDPNDEPASILIEKIRKEKEKLIKEGKIKPSKNDSIIYKGSDNCYYENKFELGDILQYEQPRTYIVKSTDYSDNYATPVLTPGKTFILGYTNESDGIYKADTKNKVIIFDDFTTASRLVDFNFKVKSSAMKILSSIDNSKFDIEYMYYLLQTIKINANTHKRFWISEYAPIKLKIHIYSEQIKIVKQIKLYYKLLDEILNNINSLQLLKSKIRTIALNLIFSDNSSYKSYYENEKLYEICDVIMGQSPEGDSITNNMSEKSIEFHQGKLCFGSYIINNSKKYSNKCNKICEENSLLFSVRAPVGDINYTDRKIGIGRGLCAIKPKGKYNIKFLYYQLLYMKQYFISKSTGSTFKAITVNTIKNCVIKQAKNDIQDKIVYFLDNAFKLIDEL